MCPNGARSALAAGLCCLPAAGARAGVALYDAGPAKGAIFSADGYHVARLESDGREDRWLVDGRVRARGPAGTLPPPGALSANGAVLLHLSAELDERKQPRGFAPALNGRRVGKVHSDLQALAVSPRGRNIAYAARVPGGWAVVSVQGIGPTLPKPPAFLAISETETLYLSDWQGGRWLYRNHKTAGRKDYDAVAASADLRRVGGLLRDGAGSSFVEVDGARFGPYASASAPAFSRNGRHWAFLASKPGTRSASFNLIVADGRATPAPACSNCSPVVSDDGRVFVDVLIMAVDENVQMHRFFLDGRELGRPSRVGLAPGGGSFVYPMLTGRGVAVGLNGKVLEYVAPLPLPSAPVEFEGRNEYHYWTLNGGSLRLVCGTLDGSDPRSGRCGALASGLHGPALNDDAPTGAAAAER